MTIIRKYDRKDRIANQHVLDEKMDTLSLDEYKYSRKKIVKNSYQNNEFSYRTTKHFNNKGHLIKNHEETSDPFIWKTTYYDNEGIMTKNIDVNHDYKRMEIIIIEK